jgi:GNAT superfamily N-acetyltransferase
VTITIRPVQSRRELAAFVDFPRRLYRGNPYWVPAMRADELNTLRRDRNPAFEFCRAEYWQAYNGSRPVGRVAGIINPRHAEKWGQPYARLGWLDFVDDPAVSAALLKTVEDWARDQGMRALHGPLGFTNLDRSGLLVEGFDQLGTMATIYNHPYYPAHLGAAGYAKETDWVEYLMEMPEGGVEKISRMADLVARRYNLRVPEFRRKRDMLPYTGQIFDLMEEAYSHLHAAIPLSRAQMDAYIRQFFGFLSPDFVPIVLDADDRLVAFGITLPSLSRALQKSRGRLLPFGFLNLLHALRRNDLADLYLVAVSPRYQGRGVNAMLMERMLTVFRRFGIRRAESNPELEDNLNVQAQWKYFQRRQHKRRRCYIKFLD